MLIFAFGLKETRNGCFKRVGYTDVALNLDHNI
jgi:hypothetical protein